MLNVTHILKQIAAWEWMQMKCPKYGHEFADKARVKGGNARWKGTRKKDRSAAMKAVRAGSDPNGGES